MFTVLFIFIFFFFKQKTAYEMRISDWSSDVCSSDLRGRHAVPASRPRLRCGDGCAPWPRAVPTPRQLPRPASRRRPRWWRDSRSRRGRGGRLCPQRNDRARGRRRPDRKSVEWGKSGAVRVDLGGGRIIKKKKKIKK